MYERVEDRLPRLQSVGDIGELLRWITSWELALQSEGLADKTIRGYTDAAVRMANWLLNLADEHPLVRDWSEVSRTHFREYMKWFQSEHTKVYANNQYRALQQFWKWYVIEEEVPDPMVNTRPPKVPERIMPMLKHDDMVALIKDAEKGRDFVSRRDAAILRFHGCTGCRLAEIAGLAVKTVDLKDRVATVIGKGDIERSVPFDQKCALALDRYLRVRARHKHAARKELWLAARNRPPLTTDGIYQMIARRGRRLGIRVHPHMFRHTFSHNWLDKGGTEGDLMALNGWKSRQMLGRYGAQGRSLRARRHYDTIDVMGGE